MNRKPINQRIQVIILTSLGLTSLNWSAAIAAETAPSQPDIPEEVLQTAVIVNARSPIDNRPLTATEYAELQLEIDRLNETPPSVAPGAKNIIEALKLRKFLKTVLPFIPIK